MKTYTLVWDANFSKIIAIRPDDRMDEIEMWQGLTLANEVKEDEWAVWEYDDDDKIKLIDEDGVHWKYAVQKKR